MKKEKSLAEKIHDLLVTRGEALTIDEIHSEINYKPQSTIRARIYDHLNKLFKKVARGVYIAIGEESSVLVVEGDGRDMSMVEDGTVDAIVNDHPYECESNIGGNRNFVSSYNNNTFKYSIKDFKEKYRVLKEGAFLVEMIPAENANNYEYLYKIKQMAKECGFEYYAKIPWKKGTKINNTGRCSKNTEDILLFSKGKARKLRKDTKKEKSTGIPSLMSGTAYMLPTCFDFQPPSSKERVHQSEKPWELYCAILEAVTLPGELVIDQFSGSGNLGKAAIKTGRFAVLWEIVKENVEKLVTNIGAFKISQRDSSVKVPEKRETAALVEKIESGHHEQMDMFALI